MHASVLVFFFFNDTATTEIYTLSLHDALPISIRRAGPPARRSDSRVRRHARQARAGGWSWNWCANPLKSEEHTSELQSQSKLECSLLPGKKKTHRLC